MDENAKILPLKAEQLRGFAELTHYLTVGNGRGESLKAVLDAFLLLLAEVWRLRLKVRYLIRRNKDLEARIIDLEMPPLGVDVETPRTISRLLNDVDYWKAKAESASTRAESAEAQAAKLESEQRAAPETDEEREAHRINVFDARMFFERIHQSMADGVMPLPMSAMSHGREWADSLRWLLLEEREARVDAESYKGIAEKAEKEAARIKADAQVLLHVLRVAVGVASPELDLSASGLEPEDRAAWDLCVRTIAAADAGSLASIRAEIVAAREPEGTAGDAREAGAA